jgi:hypothetical protein
MRLRYLVAEIERNAQRCLADPLPPAEIVRELAADVLALTRVLRASREDTAEHPYRPDPLDATGAESFAALVALEHALAESQARLVAAQRELADLRAGATPPPRDPDAR